MAGEEGAPLVEENCHGRKVVAPAASLARIEITALLPAKKFSQQFKSRASVRRVCVSRDDSAL